MKNPKGIILSILSALGSALVIPCLLSAAQPIPGTFESHLDRLQKWAGKVGIQVVSLQSGKPVWEHRSGEALVPASLVKLLTSYAALKCLGPNCRFSTSVWAVQEPLGGRVPGNIWIKGEGDIFFVSEKALDLAMKLRGRGIRSVEGGVYVDNRYFEPLSAQVCLDSNCSDTYNPVVSATSLDFNSISFHIAPAPKAGAPLQVSWSPPGDYVQLHNLGITAHKGVKTLPRIQSLGVSKDGRERFQVTGRISTRVKGGLEYRFNVDEPASFFARSVKMFLERSGVEVRGQGAGAGDVPAGAKKLAAYESPPLGDLLYGLNKHSNNFMAETLLRSLGARVLGVPGTTAKGLAAVSKTLLELGIPEREAALDNGSGLSRQSRVSPRAFCQVLAKAHQDSSIGPAFVASLAVSGQEGTLRRRMCSSPLIVRGKTGTLGNVVSFAGYVSAPGNEGYAVAVILNEVQNLWEAREALDSFLENLPILCNAP